jgi:hypothetical protein
MRPCRRTIITPTGKERRKPQRHCCVLIVMRQLLELPRIGLGMAALGRPGYYIHLHDRQAVLRSIGDHDATAGPSRVGSHLPIGRPAAATAAAAKRNETKRRREKKKT